MLTGEYVEQARTRYKTVEGRQFLAAVREAIRLIDLEMKKPSSAERGSRIAKITSALEMAADSYDLFGEKDRRRARLRDEQAEEAIAAVTSSR